jgi:general secretion pathway protein D
MSLVQSWRTKGNPLRSGVKAMLLACLVITGVIWLPAQETPAGFQSYTLRHAAADDVAARLRKLLVEMAPDAKVLADPQSNQVVVQGSASTQQLAAKMLQTLDQPTEAPSEPAVSQKEVKGYRVDGDLPAIVKWLQQHFPASTGARITADERTKQVIVIAPATVQREVSQLLQSGQTPPPKVNVPAASEVAPAANNLVHTLRHITWRDLEGELVRLWGDQLEVTKARNGEIVNVSIADASGARPIMQIDRREGDVSFTGTGRTIAMWRTIIEAIDSPQDGERITQLIPIRKADPSLVVSTISLLNTTAEVPDEQVTKAVPVRGTNRKRNAADLVSMLYQQAGEQAPAAQPAPARPAAPAGRPAAPGTQPPAATPGAPAAAPGEAPADNLDGGLFGPVQIEIIGDSIIIKGNRRDVEKVKKLIEDIERTVAETQPVVEVYHLQHINADAATTIVSELYTEILSERTGLVSIRSLGEPNAILLIGREESVNVVKELIKKLDQPSPPASKFEVFRLKHVSSVNAELTVRNFFVNQPGRDTNPRTGIGTRVQIIADFRTNSLIVQASPRDMEEVRRLVDSIDVEDSPSTAEVRIFQLKNALAETLATVLQSAISGQAAAGGQQQPGGQQPGQQQPQQGAATTQSQSTLPSVSLEFMRIDQAGGKLLRSGILADVQVTADTNTNSLIVRAPSKSMELIKALIEQLDKLPEMSSQVKVFEIMNGNANSLTTMLQQLFGQTTTGQGNQNTLGGLFGLQNQLQTGTGGGESSLVPLRFAVDQRTNSIIASGSENDLQVVETILLRLDEDVDDRRLTVVRLRNTQAASVATAVQQYLTNLQQQFQQLVQQSTITATESVERQVFVIAENVTNSLIVSASPRYQEEILKVIQELDIRPPMVMVQVLIAEVTLSDTFEFGTEFGLQDSLVFERGKAVGTPPGSDVQSNPGFNFNSSPIGAYPNVRSYQQETMAGQSLTNFALGRSSSALGYGGLVLSAANESINILLRALQDEGRVQILSRPQVMTMHNQPAYVQVGANVARPAGTTISNGVSQQNVTYEDTGLILSILPLINDDGIIVMGIEAERSALGAESDQNATTISSGVAGSGPIVIKPLNRTKASTTISARDGQTVVFAGLITKTNRLTLRRVPYLANVPVLGNLFQFRSNSEARTELLVVMTPHLVKDEAEAELIKAQETQRMSWCLADVVNVTGDWGLGGGHCAFCNGEAPVIFPDVDPTGIHSLPTPAEPLSDSRTSTSGESSSRRAEPMNVSADSGAIVGPPVPPSDSATVSPPRDVTPANFQRIGTPRRLPIPK